MNKKTIIFISGIFVPNWLGKTKFLWDKSKWSNYNCIWLTSRIPYSDTMAEKELDNFQFLLKKYPGAIVAGQSLGAWWAANLACRSNISKLILWTPLVDHQRFPIFNASAYYNPCNQVIKPQNTGSDKVLVYYADDDSVVPYHSHACYDINHFKSLSFKLRGGHYFQSNHQEALEYMKDWIEI